MFYRFNRRWFQALKLQKLVADMVLHDWLKFWTRLPKVIFKFGGAKVCEFHTVSNGH